MLLVAPAGVGKTALVEGIAEALLTEERHSAKPIAKRSIVEYEVAGLMSNTKYRGQFEQKMQMIIEKAETEQSILFLDEMHTITTASKGAQNGMDIAQVLKPALSRDSLSIIGSTTPNELPNLLSDPAIMRRFKVVKIGVPSSEEMVDILEQSAPRFLESRKLSISRDECARLVRLGNKYLSKQNNPDRSFEILDQAAVYALREGAEEIDQRHLLNALDDLSDVRKLKSHKAVTSAKMKERLAKEFVGYSKSCEQIINSYDAAEKNWLIHLSGPENRGKMYLAHQISDMLGSVPHRYKCDTLSDIHQILQSMETIIGIESMPTFLIEANFACSKEFEQVVSEALEDGFKGQGATKTYAEGVTVVIVSHGEKMRDASVGFTAKAEEKQNPNYVYLDEIQKDDFDSVYEFISEKVDLEARDEMCEPPEKKDREDLRREAHINFVELEKTLIDID